MGRVITTQSVINELTQNRKEENNREFWIAGEKERKVFKSFLKKNMNLFYNPDQPYTEDLIEFSSSFGKTRWDLKLFDTKFGTILIEVKNRYCALDRYSSFVDCINYNRKKLENFELNWKHELNLENDKMYERKYNMEKSETKWCKLRKSWGAMIEQPKFLFLKSQPQPVKLYINFFENKTVIFNIDKIKPEFKLENHNKNTVQDGYQLQEEKMVYYIPISLSKEIYDFGWLEVEQE